MKPTVWNHWDPSPHIFVCIILASPNVATYLHGTMDMEERTFCKRKKLPETICKENKRLFLCDRNCSVVWLVIIFSSHGRTLRVLAETHIYNPKLAKVHICILRRPQIFLIFPSYMMLISKFKKNLWDFFKFLWPSQNIWTLPCIACFSVPTQKYFPGLFLAWYM